MESTTIVVSDEIFNDIFKPTMTLAECDEMQDDSQLITLIDELISGYCTGFSFIDDEQSTTQVNVRTLFYDVDYPRMTGYVDRGESGSYADSEDVTARIEVEVNSAMTISQIAALVEAAVKQLEGNYFTR